ncbi:MAG: type II toxin-antitoxin system VapC family toxin, partial [Phycisphaerales bacterium]|nr:type II toxin-antitoxin system VapC family toxin [Phycisphaerales bacterium]
MKSLVVDANVAVKWFVPEDGADIARSLLDPKFHLLAPSLLWIEIAAVAWKLRRRDLLTADEAKALLRDAMILPVEMVDTGELLAEALSLAIRYDRTVYDSLYLALAV